MEKKKQTDSIPSHDASPDHKGGGAYFPLDKEKKSGNVMNAVMGLMLLVSVGVGGYLGYKIMFAGGGDEIMRVEEIRTELIQSVLAISDEDDLPREEAASRQERASTAIQAHMKEQKSIIENPKTDPARAQLGPYKGILTKCFIGGHDVHWISENGAILEHIGVEKQLTGNALVAREIINANNHGTVVIVYEQGYEIYDYNGTLLKVKKD